MSEDAMELDVPEPEIRKSIVEVKPNSYIVLADPERQLEFPASLSPSWVQDQLSGTQWKFIKSNNIKITPNLIVSMYKDAKKGLSKRAILARHGFPPVRWSEWQKKADEGQEPYYLWSQCMFYAASQVEASVLENVRLQATGDFKAAKWLLEHVNPTDYAPTPKEQTVNIAGDVNATQNNTTNTQSVNYMDDEKAKQIASLLQTMKVLPSNEEPVEAEVVEDGS